MLEGKGEGRVRRLEHVFQQANDGTRLHRTPRGGALSPVLDAQSSMRHDAVEVRQPFDDLAAEKRISRAFAA